VTLQSPAERVTVVGGGVVGLCCAYYLRKSGLQVTVLERDRVGSGASRGNAGEICPDLVTPLPGPGVIGPAVRSLPRPDAALHIHPRPSVDLARFLVGFARHATRSRHRAGAGALAGLARGTLDLFEEIGADGVDLAPNKTGFLYVFGSADSARGTMREYAELGAPLAASGLLGPHDLTDREPSLGAGARAGFLVENQWSIDPNLFVDGLADRLRALGVAVVEGARVTAVEDAGSRVVVHTTSGSVDGDAAVVAAGIWTRPICRTLGLDLNIFPGKGYSFSVSAERQPRQLIHLGDAHVGVAPLDKKVRIAGTMEFDRDHDRFHARRIAAIVAAARPYLDGIDWDARQDEWVGPRPMTPDGLPAIGALPGHGNVLVAAGHNMLGLMLSPATGRLMSDLLTGRRTESEIRAFAPARMARRSSRG
jgi:D-amino-acid dehydrogenase